MSDIIDLQNDYDRIYLTFYPRMIRFAKEYVIFDEDAENIVQDVFLFLWEKRKTLKIDINLTSYLFKLVKNHCIDFLRHKSIVNEYVQEYEMKLSALEQLDYAFSSEKDIEKIINDAINQLPNRCREIFIKSRIKGEKYQEIAEELNLSVNTIEKQISIALKKLRIELKDYLPLLIFLIG